MIYDYRKEPHPGDFAFFDVEGEEIPFVFYYDDAGCRCGRHATVGDDFPIVSTYIDKKGHLRPSEIWEDRRLRVVPREPDARELARRKLAADAQRRRAAGELTAEECDLLFGTGHDRSGDTGGPVMREV